ncbi:MAG: HD domain-containing protein, partial [Litorimonas sp.]
QVIIARKMGQASGPVEIAVERFMREYFTNAKEVGALTRIACAKLEAQKSIRLPKGLDALLPGSRRNLRNKALVLDHGRLSFSDPMMIKSDPSIIMQLFETAGRRNVDIHPNAFTEIDFRRNLMDADFRRSPDNSRLFQKTLLKAKAPYATLRAMNEAGVLGRYLIEFGGIVGRTQFNMHHAYTVDEHTLRLVDNFDNLRKGRLETVNPLITDIVKRFNSVQVLIIMLTCLLHDTGKGQGDQCIEGAQLARKACRRMGVSQEITDTCAWLVRRHLDMSETAQRRDISDPETIAEFAALVGSQERLELLFALTVVDIRSVGPGIWNDWKGALLRNLFTATTNYLKGRDDLAPAARANAIQEQLFEKLRPEMVEAIKPITQDMPHQYWLSFNMATLLGHARFFDGIIQNALRASGSKEDSGLKNSSKQTKSGRDINSKAAVQSRLNRMRNVTELWILTSGRPGLFADLTKAISSCGASISGAHLHTTHSGQVMNVFYLHGGDGQAYGQDSPHLIETLRHRTMSATREQVDNLTIPAAIRSRRAGAIPVASKVKFSDIASGNLTIIEVKGRDRPGLLYSLARLMSEELIDIYSAHIEVVGAQAIDAFYVRARDGDGTINAARRKKLKARFIDIFDVDKTAKSAA